MITTGSPTGDTAGYETEWTERSLDLIRARYAAPLPERAVPVPPAAGDMRALGEWMRPVALELACRLRARSRTAVGRRLAGMGLQELYALLTVALAMVDVDRPVEELLGWMTVEVEGGRGRGRELEPCGTTGAYARHYANGEEPCDPCKAAKSEQDAANKDASNARRRKRTAERREAAQTGVAA